MANLTTSPWFIQQLLTDTGVVASGYKLFTYAAGSTTKLAAYTDVSGLVAHANPIILDSAGRIPSGLFLLPASYKFVLAPPGDTDPPSAPIWSRDNQSATPGTTVDQDFTITAGEALSANDAIYISDGSGGLTAGRAYHADADNTYSSTTPTVGFAVADVAMGAGGTARGGGRMTGFIGLTIGAKYYLSGTSGAITTTAPTNARFVGQADSVSSLLIATNPPQTTTATIAALIDLRAKSICDGVLTLTSGVPFTKDDVTAATTIYFTPYNGNQVGLYVSSVWTLRTFAELSIAVPATTSTGYDLFVYDNAGVAALEAVAWSNSAAGTSARFGSGTYATDLPKQDGVKVKSTNGTVIDATRRYIGSCRTTAVSGQTEDSFNKRLLFNENHRKRRPMRKTDSTDTWTYTTATWRQFNGAAANQVEFVIGSPEVEVDLRAVALFDNSGGGSHAAVGIGLDTTTAPTTGCLGMKAYSTATGTQTPAWASLTVAPAFGFHYAAPLENSLTATSTTTWYGDNGAPTIYQSGISGSVGT